MTDTLTNHIFLNCHEQPISTAWTPHEASDITTLIALPLQDWRGPFKTLDPLPPTVFPGLTSAAGNVSENPVDHIRRGEERGSAEAVRDSACWRADGDTEQRTVEENEGTGSGVVEEEDATESLPGGQPDHAAPCHSSRGGEWLEQVRQRIRGFTKSRGGKT